jgi:hypothetical protein
VKRDAGSSKADVIELWPHGPPRTIEGLPPDGRRTLIRVCIVER